MRYFYFKFFPKGICEPANVSRAVISLLRNMRCRHAVCIWVTTSMNDSYQQNLARRKSQVLLYLSTHLFNEVAGTSKISAVHHNYYF